MSVTDQSSSWDAGSQGTKSRRRTDAGVRFGAQAYKEVVSDLRPLTFWHWFLLGSAAVLVSIFQFLHLSQTLPVSQNIVLGSGFLAGLCLVAGVLVFVHRLVPPAALYETISLDRQILRDAIDHDDIAIAITDRAGELVCANNLFGSWFGSFLPPPNLPLDGDGESHLEAAARIAWSDGKARSKSLTIGVLRFDAEILRSGREDAYLIWRFLAIESVDMVSEAAHHINGVLGEMLDNSGIMTALTTFDGQLKAASAAFVTRALGRFDAPFTDRDIVEMLRLDDESSAYFVREGSHASSIRLLPVPVISEGVEDSQAPLLLVLIDEEGWTTERRSAQDYVEILLSLLPFGLALVDRDGQFLFVNEAFCRAAGVSTKPRYPSDIVVAEDKGPLSDMVRRNSTGQQGQQGGNNMTIRLASQADEPVSIRITSVRGMGGAVVLLSLKDSSEEDGLKRQIAQASKMQAVGQLAGGVAHDFNNILTAILGACDLMLMRHTLGDGDYDDIQQIRSNANRAASLTRQLLAFSRQQTLHPQILQLSDVISEVSHLLKRLIGENITLSVRHGRGLGAVRADPGQLEQVIINLAVNARDAMPEGGTLTIETFAVTSADVRRIANDIMPPAKYSALRITDTGTGIPADILPNIFEPFFTTKDVGKGTGLGLSTVYGIIKQSAGFIFPSTKAGQGSRFTIYLPIYREEEIQNVPTQPKKAPQEQWGSETILLVEDEDMVRAVAERSLVRAGYTVLTASHGEEGIERFNKAEMIDLVVSDVVMPMMDGPTMVRELREKRVDLPVLFMSGYAEEQSRKSINIADVRFLPKPFSVNQLTNAVAGALTTVRKNASRG